MRAGRTAVPHLPPPHAPPPTHPPSRTSTTPTPATMKSAAATLAVRGPRIGRRRGGVACVEVLVEVRARQAAPAEREPSVADVRGVRLVRGRGTGTGWG